MQKLPTKKKTNKRKLDVRENEMKVEYYRELLRFYGKNEISYEDNNNNNKFYNTVYNEEQELVKYLILS